MLDWIVVFDKQGQLTMDPLAGKVSYEGKSRWREREKGEASYLVFFGN